MLVIRRSQDRGHFDFGWLQTFHTFSFGEYYDPSWMGYRSIRVINQDTVAPGAGFPTHPHKDMEILTYVFEGEIAHRDSMGNEASVKAGEFQVMSAGTGVTHSEFNPLKDKQLRLMQIWLMPDRRGIEPRYDQKFFGMDQLTGGFRLIASKTGREDSLLVNQDVDLYIGVIPEGKKYSWPLRKDRHYWLQVVEGDLTAGGQKLTSGDAMAFDGNESLEILPSKAANLILFDLA